MENNNMDNNAEIISENNGMQNNAEIISENNEMQNNVEIISENSAEVLNTEPNQNNYVSEPTPEPEPEGPKDTKTTKLLIAFLVLLNIGLLAFLVYTKFLKEEKPVENNTQEKENQNTNNNEKQNTPKEIKLEGVTFKTSDGKNELKVVSKDDSEALAKAKSIGAYESLAGEINYLGYYNGKIILLFEDTPSVQEAKNNNLKYVVLGGQIGDGGQCRDSNSFILNVVDNTLVNLTNGTENKVHKVGEKYYFSEGDCALGFIPRGVYDENLKKLGLYYLNSDSEENIYVLNNDHIVKYDKNGTVVKTTTEKYSTDTVNRENVSYKDTLYIIENINGKLSLVNISTDEKYALTGLDEDFAGITDDKPSLEMKVNNDVIEISSYSFENDNYTLKYTFDASTKTLTKKN